ncbi:MAG: nuclear transport factor 2 family protein [Acidobacteriota bacterium]
MKKAVNDTAALLAKNDAAGLEKVYADNYMLVGPDGAVSNRAERLASFKSGETKFDSFSYDEVNVRVHPDGTGAIVIAKASASGLNRGKKVSSPLRVTQVWVKNKDGWQQVSAQATPILAGDSGLASNTAASNKPSATPPAMSNTNAKANSNMNANK